MTHRAKLQQRVSIEGSERADVTVTSVKSNAYMSIHFFFVAAWS